MNNRETGSLYEKKAAAFLEQKGLVIISRNFCCRGGEIDLIARDGKYLVFVEVRYRRTEKSGSARASVDRKKQRRISNAARFYLLRYGYGDSADCRFDVVAFEGERIYWIKNAFESC